MTNLTKYQPRNNDELTIIEQRANRIAKLDAKDAYRDVLNTISSLFPLYGIDGDITFYSSVAKEIIQTFGQISSKEIEIAFRLFSAESLELDDDIKFYGKVNMHTIGKILNAYMLWRNKITYQIEKEKQDKLEEDILLKKREIMSREYDKDFENKLKNFKSENFDDVPIYWYDTANRLGYLTWEEGEKEALWEEAKRIALEEKPDSDNIYDRKSHMKKIAEGNIPRAKVIAYKLAVFKKIIKFTLDGK